MIFHSNIKKLVNSGVRHMPHIHTYIHTYIYICTIHYLCIMLFSQYIYIYMNQRRRTGLPFASETSKAASLHSSKLASFNFVPLNSILVVAAYFTLSLSHAIFEETLSTVIKCLFKIIFVLTFVHILVR